MWQLQRVLSLVPKTFSITQAVGTWESAQNLSGQTKEQPAEEIFCSNYVLVCHKNGHIKFVNYKLDYESSFARNTVTEFLISWEK